MKSVTVQPKILPCLLQNLSNHHSPSLCQDLRWVSATGEAATGQGILRVSEDVLGLRCGGLRRRPLGPQRPNHPVFLGGGWGGGDVEIIPVSPKMINSPALNSTALPAPTTALPTQQSTSQTEGSTSIASPIHIRSPCCTPPTTPHIPRPSTPSWSLPRHHEEHGAEVTGRGALIGTGRGHPMQQLKPGDLLHSDWVRVGQHWRNEDWPGQVRHMRGYGMRPSWGLSSRALQ